MIDRILLSEIPEDEREAFIEWMRGRQVPVSEGEPAYYRHDYLWWRDHVKHGQ